MSRHPLALGILILPHIVRDIVDTVIRIKEQFEISDEVCRSNRKSILQGINEFAFLPTHLRQLFCESLLTLGEDIPLRLFLGFDEVKAVSVLHHALIDLFVYSLIIADKRGRSAKIVLPIPSLP